MNYSKIIKTIFLWLGILALFCGGFLSIVLNLFLKIPEDGKSYAGYILGIMMFPTILFVVLFILLNPFRSTNLNELKKIARALNDLEKGNALETLQDLKGLPNIIAALKMEIFGKLKIVVDYERYIKQKKAESMWVLGASLLHPEKIEAALRKEITCEFLCAGTESTVIERAKRVIKQLGKENARKYIDNGKVKIYHIGEGQIEFPRTFYNPDANDAEILIYFPKCIENKIGKHPILIKNTQAALEFKDDYNKIKDQHKYKKNEKTEELEDAEMLKKILADDITT